MNVAATMQFSARQSVCGRRDCTARDDYGDDVEAPQARRRPRRPTAAIFAEDEVYDVFGRRDQTDHAARNRPAARPAARPEAAEPEIPVLEIYHADNDIVDDEAGPANAPPAPRRAAACRRPNGADAQERMLDEMHVGNVLHWSGASNKSHPFVDSLPPARERIHLFIPISMWHEGARRMTDIREDIRSRNFFTLFVLMGQCLGYASHLGSPGTHVMDKTGRMLEKVSILVNLLVRNTGRCDFTAATRKPDSFDLADNRNHVGLLITISINDEHLRFYELLKALVDDTAKSAPEERRRYLENLPIPQEPEEPDANNSDASDSETSHHHHHRHRRHGSHSEEPDDAHDVHGDAAHDEAHDDDNPLNRRDKAVAAKHRMHAPKPHHLELSTAQIAKKPDLMIESIDYLPRAIRLFIDLGTHSKIVSNRWSELTNVPHLEHELRDGSLQLHKILTIDKALELARLEAQTQADEMRKNGVGSMLSQFEDDDNCSICYTEVNSFQMAKESWYVADSHREQAPEDTAHTATSSEAPLTHETMSQRIIRSERLAMEKPDTINILRNGFAPQSVEPGQVYDGVSGTMDICTMTDWATTGALWSAYNSTETTKEDMVVVTKRIEEETNAMIHNARLDDNVVAQDDLDTLNNDTIESIANCDNVAAIDPLLNADETYHFIAPEPDLAWKIEPCQLAASRLSNTPMPWCTKSVAMSVLQTVARFTKEPIEALELAVYDRNTETFGQEEYLAMAEQLELPRLPQGGTGIDDWTMLGMDKENTIIQSEIAFIGVAVGRAKEYVNERYDACINRAKRMETFAEATHTARMDLHMTEDRMRELERESGVGKPRCICGMSRCFGGIDPELCCVRRKFGPNSVVNLDSDMHNNIICALTRVAIREMAVRFGPSSFVPPSVTRMGKFVEQRGHLSLPFVMSIDNLGIFDTTLVNMMIHLSRAGVTVNHDAVIKLMSAREIACLGGVAGALAYNIKLVGPYGVGKSAALHYLLLLSVPDASVQQMGGASERAILPIHDDRPYGDCIVVYDELPPIFTTDPKKLGGASVAMYRMMLSALTTMIIKYKMTCISEKNTRDEKMGYVEKNIQAVIAIAGATNDKSIDSPLQARLYSVFVRSETETRSSAIMACACDPKTGRYNLSSAINDLDIPRSTIDLFYDFNALCFITAQAVQCHALPMPDRSMYQVMMLSAVTELKRKYGAGCALKARTFNLAWPLITSFVIWKAVASCFSISLRDRDVLTRRFMYQHIVMLAPYMHAGQDEAFATIAFCISQVINPIIYETAKWIADTSGVYNAMAEYHKRGLNACDHGLFQIQEAKEIYDKAYAETPNISRIRLVPFNEVAAHIFAKHAPVSPLVPKDFDAFSTRSMYSRKTNFSSGEVTRTSKSDRKESNDLNESRRMALVIKKVASQSRRVHEKHHESASRGVDLQMIGRHAQQDDEVERPADAELLDYTAIDDGNESDDARAREVLSQVYNEIPEMKRDDIMDIETSFSTPEGFRNMMRQHCKLAAEQRKCLLKVLEGSRGYYTNLGPSGKREYVQFSRNSEDSKALSEAGWRCVIQGEHILPTPLPWKYKEDSMGNQCLIDPNYLCILDTVQSLAIKMAKRKKSYAMTVDDALGTLQTMCDTTFTAHLLPRVSVGEMVTMTNIERYRVALWNHPQCVMEEVPLMIADIDRTFILIEALVLDPVTIIRDVLRSVCNGDTFTTRTLLPIVSSEDPALYMTFEAVNVQGKVLSTESPLRLSKPATAMLSTCNSAEDLKLMSDTFAWKGGSELQMLDDMFKKNGLKHPELQTYAAQRRWKEEHFSDPSMKSESYPFPITNLVKSAGQIYTSVTGESIDLAQQLAPSSHHRETVEAPPAHRRAHHAEKEPFTPIPAPANATISVV